MFSTADRLLIGSLAGATALAHYSICLQLAQQIHTLPAAGAGYLFPTVSRRLQAGESVRKLALVSTLGFCVMGLVIALPLFVAGRWILTLWIGAGFADENTSLLRWLAVAFVVLAANIGPYFFMMGATTARFVSLVVVASGLLSLATGVVLIPLWGVAAAAAMRGVYAASTGTIVFAMISNLYFKEAPGKVARAVAADGAPRDAAR